MRRIAAVIAVLGIVAAVGFVAFRCRPQPDDRALIERLVADAQVAVQRRDLRKIMRIIDDNYHDRYGYTKQDLRRLAISAGRSFHSIRVAPTIKGIVVADGKASLQVDVLVWVDEQLQPDQYTIRATLVKRGRQWKVISSDGWQQTEE